MVAHPARISSLALLARLEPSLRFRFSLIALGRGDKKLLAGVAHTGRATSSGQKRLRREELPVAEGKSISIARLRPMQDVSNSRETDQHRFTALRETDRLH